MPKQYEKIRDSMIASGDPQAKKHAAMTFIAKGKGGSRSSRAASLQSDKPRSGGAPRAGRALRGPPGG